MEKPVFRLKKQPNRHANAHSPLKIHLVRHAEALNDDGIDSHGPQLTPHGVRQAQRLGKRLSKERYAAIYSSDLTRAQQTADAIAQHHSDDALTLTRDLREVACAHTAAGMSRTTLHDDRSIREEKEAIERVIHHLLDAHNQGETILVVSHGNITRSLIPMLGHIDPAKAPLFEIFNASLSIVDIWPSKRAVVRLVNCVSHLPPRMVT
jgi:broad specificity phosphatase PhoE